MLALNPEAYRSFIRPLLFSLPPEAAQTAAELVLKQELVWRALSPALRVRSPMLRTDLCGLKLENPVGLAAGYDKDCQFLPSIAALGFGYVTAGTVTEAPRLGNPRPRVLRYVKEQSLVNALGFPSRGLDFAARRLAKARRSLGATAVIVSVSGVTAGEIVRCHRRLEPLADAIEINISSPNTAGLRVFQEAPAFAELIGRVSERRKKPLLVKLPPFGPSSPEAAADGPDSERLLRLVAASVEQGVDGLTVANTRPVAEPRLAAGSGGLSGKLLFPDTVRMVAEVKAEAGDKVAINACGGIFSGEDAWQALQAGATTVQLLTGLIYRGPGVVRRINQELLRCMARDEARSLNRLSCTGYGRHMPTKRGAPPLRNAIVVVEWGRPATHG